MSIKEKFNFINIYLPEYLRKPPEEEDISLKVKKLLKGNWKTYAFLINALAGIIGFVLGYIGYFLAFDGDPVQQSPSNILFQVLRLYALQNEIIPPELPLEIAKFICPLSLTYLAVLTLITVFQEHFTKLRLKFFKNHIIICGLNKWTSELIKSIILTTKRRKRKRQIVVISKELDNEYKAKIDDLGVIILYGNYSDAFILNKANICKAKHLIAFTEEDSKNMEIAINAKDIIKKKHKKKVKCFVHIKDQHLYSSFSKHNIFQEDSEFLEIKIYNNYTNDARVLFLSTPFEIDIDTGDKIKHPHLLIIGFGHLGESVLLQAIKMCHYADDRGIKITILEKKAKALEKHFLFHYPEILSEKKGWEKPLTDISFLNSNFNNLKKVEAQIKYIDQNHPVTAIIICIEEETNAIKFGVDLIPMLARFEAELDSEQIPIKLHFPISVYLDENEDIFKLPSNYPISAFGLINYTCSHEIVINEMLDLIAKAIHEDYRQKQEKEKQKEKQLPMERMPFIVEWDKLSPAIKDSNRQQADHIPIKLRALNIQIIPKKQKDQYIQEMKKQGKKVTLFEGFTEKENEKLARMEHNRWCAERWINGWKYSEIRDNNKKLHPLLVPFNALTDEQQKIDWEFINNIPILLRHKSLGLELLRIEGFENK
ncbi:MAG: RyR domain-containing protein [Candidatus Hodarchaeota archaeon]